jgi:hypothetical protein
MNLSEEDGLQLQRLCQEYKVNYEKVLKLLSTIKEFEIKDRRTGIYDELKRIITSKDFD